MQFGPTMRIPAARTFSASARSRAAPSPPTSLKPAEITISPRTPLRMQSSTTPSTRRAGTTTTARSTGSGIAATLG
jgi:hypothetical protein